jgi:hypothetical protein
MAIQGHAWSHAASARDGSDQMAAVCIAMEWRVVTMLIVSAGLLLSEHRCDAGSG